MRLTPILFALLACLAETSAEAPAAEVSQDCSNYPLRLPGVATPAPGQFKEKQPCDVNGDGKTDFIVLYNGGGSALYLNCDLDRYCCPVQSAARLSPKPLRAGNAWAPLVIEWETNRSTFIHGRLHKVDAPPFAAALLSEEELQMGAHGYRLPFLVCEALDLSAPLFRFNDLTTIIQHATASVRTISIQLAARQFMIDVETQEEYSIGNVFITDLNADSHPDALLRYQEKLGSGRQAFAGLFLGCGGSDFVYVSSLPLGAVKFGGADSQISLRQVPLRDGSGSVLVVEQVKGVEGDNPPQKLPSQWDLYLYSDSDKTFPAIGTVATPDDAQIERALDNALQDRRKKPLWLPTSGH